MKDDATLKKVLTKIETQMRTNNIEGFKYVVNNLVKSALKATEDIQKNWNHIRDREKLHKKIELLHHELDNLKRFCETAIG